LIGELFATPLLLDFARAVFKGTENDDTETILSSSELHPLAQAYPSYWSRLSLTKNHTAAAAAVNFPHGRGLLDEVFRIESELRTEKELAFIEFFSSPIEGLDYMAGYH